MLFFGITSCAGSKRVLGRWKRDWFGRSGTRGLGSRPGNTMRWATGNPGDFDAFQSLDQSRPPIDSGAAIALLAVVVITPSKDLAGIRYGKAMQSADRNSSHLLAAQSFHQSWPTNVLICSMAETVIVAFSPCINLYQYDFIQFGILYIINTYL